MANLGEGSQIPFISKYGIVRKVEELLNECWNGTFPIDVEKICDYLGIAILPVAKLADSFGVDAFVSANFKIIYVDAEEFELESYRYRFSVAHELGHYVLHREYFPSRVWSFDEWHGLSDGGISGVAEFQANYFAGSLLAPEDELLRALNVGFGGSFARNYFNTEREEIKRILTSVQRVFKVSEQVIHRRIRDTVYGFWYRNMVIVVMYAWIMM